MFLLPVINLHQKNLKVYSTMNETYIQTLIYKLVSYKKLGIHF